MSTPADPARGQIIFLNGATSAGKSTVAIHLLEVLDRPYFHLPVDAINAMRAHRAMPPDELEGVLERTVLGYHRAVAGWAAAGNDVVVDHVLRERSWLLDCLTLFAGGDVVLVGIHCSPQELERRELARGDRTPGRAAYHLARVHEHVQYDVECDTTSMSPEDCARRIKSYLDRPSTGRAFDRLRATYLPDLTGSARTVSWWR